MVKSWWCWIYRGPTDNGKYCASARCELNGGSDDAGLMESDLQALFSALIELAHPDLTDLEIRACFKKACKDVME